MTGAASGIDADLATPDGRDVMVEAVRERSGGIVDAGEQPAQLIDGSTKHALNRWMRTIAEGREMLAQAVPMPLGGYGEPEEVAELIVWLASPANSKTTGQVIFIDGGADVVLRGPTAF